MNLFPFGVDNKIKGFYLLNIICIKMYTYIFSFLNIVFTYL